MLEFVHKNHFAFAKFFTEVSEQSGRSINRWNLLGHKNVFIRLA